MWQCKDCTFSTAKRIALYKHYKLQHRHGPHNPQPCLHQDCPCTFRTSTALHTHLSRYHSTERLGPLDKRKLVTFKCHMCGKKDLSTEKTYFQHINQHLKNHETVECMFEGCDFKSNLYGTFRSHRSRKHASSTLHELKVGLVTETGVAKSITCISEPSFAEVDDETELECYDDDDDVHDDNQNLPHTIERAVAALLLKLESILHVSSSAIDEIVSELQYIVGSVSAPVTHTIIDQILKKNNCHLDKTVLKELADSVCKHNPVNIAIGNNGPLSTAYKRKQYYKNTFSLVEPVEYKLDVKDNYTFQYIPILQSLQQLLNANGILEKALSKGNQRKERKTYSGVMPTYRSFFDGIYFKENEFCCQDEFQIYIGLYVDDFEVCNPLGTSRKKHKVCAVYWVLLNLPPIFLSSLTSINLALLCKSTHVKTYGFDQVLDPLLRDLAHLEEEGIFVEKLGKSVNGTVQYVAADNLGAHSIGGFIESFSGQYVCRFCTGKKEDFQTEEVRSGAFQLRTKESHSKHVQTVEENEAMTNCFGVKKNCPLTGNLKHFHVMTGYPPDILHDLFEGIVPVELARCLSVLISKKYFTLDILNNLIKQFPYKWADKTDCPSPIPLKFSTTSTIGGNAHENWVLLRLLPFIIGSKVPYGEQAWEILMELKDIVELVVAPYFTEETIAFLDCKISDHRQHFQELFENIKLIPKHHFVEHYPHMIRCFGPLVAVWTMRYEAKHSFFKQVARYTNCFKNILLSLAMKHQHMMAHYFQSPSLLKSELVVTNVSTVPLDVVKDNFKQAVKQKYPNLTVVHLAKTASYYGTKYSVGMILAVGSTGGLPDFAEIVQLLILHGEVDFLVKKLSSWYIEHYRSYQLDSPTNEVFIIKHSELEDYYPLSSYMVEGKCMVTLKRFIHVTSSQLTCEKNR